MLKFERIEPPMTCILYISDVEIKLAKRIELCYHKPRLSRKYSFGTYRPALVIKVIIYLFYSAF